MNKAPSGMVKSAVLIVLREALSMASADPDWRGGPAEYDYLPATLIVECVGRLDEWQTLEYESPSPATVLRHLWRLYDEGSVWMWGEGAPATMTRRWALVPEHLRPTAYSEYSGTKSRLDRALDGTPMTISAAWEDER